MSYNFLSTYGIDKKIMSILGIDKLSILCIYNASTYDIDKTEFSTPRR